MGILYTSAMGKFIKPGRIVVCLNGRFAGRKAIVVKQNDDGNKKIAKRMRVKPFIRYVNYNHIMPTRYQLPAAIDPKALVTDVQMDTDDGRIEAKKEISMLFKEKFQTVVPDKNNKPSKDIAFLRKRLRF